MPPRPRRRIADTDPPIAYTYPGAAKANAPTAETAQRLTPAAMAEQPIPPATPAPESPDDDIRFPQLSWQRGETGDYAETYGPLYVHDKISPVDFIDTLLRLPDAGAVAAQGQLGFAAHNGWRDADGQPAPHASWFPYQYRGHWTNRLIRATGQRAMASLLHKDGMRGQVDLIYMDPPYNISFKSNFQVGADSPETEATLDNLPYDPIAVNAFRDAYRNGVHSYLDGLYEQLKLGRELLADTGSFIMQIGPENLHQVALLMGEVFNPHNHVATIPYRTANMPASRHITGIGNWLVWFAKDIDQTKSRKLRMQYQNRSETLQYLGTAAKIVVDDEVERNLSRQERENPDLIPANAKIFTTHALDSSLIRAGRSVPYYHHPDGRPCDEHNTAWDDHKCTELCDVAENDCPLGKQCGPNCHANAYPCGTDRHWSVSLRGLHSIAMQGRLQIGKKGALRFIRYESEAPGKMIDALWETGGIVSNKQYIVETPARVLERVLLMTTDPGDLVLDLTCGSGAMPIQAETWGRRWIACDVSAVSIAIARERITLTTYPYHLLLDSPEGHRRDHELAQALLPPERRVPFAPRESYGYDPAYETEAEKRAGRRQGLVQERQMRVSAATLAYGADPVKDVIWHPDRTVPDGRRRRVASAFAVESDSPYRSVRPDEVLNREAAASAVDVVAALQTAGFTLRERGGGNQPDPVTARITGNLEQAGVLQPGHGRWRVENMQPAERRDLTHTGALVTPDGQRHKAHFYIGAADEVISSTKTAYAANAALTDPDARHLLMVGFARDGDALPVNAQFPTLTILQVAANRDLQLPHLKDGREDHAFTIVSEPEIKLHRQPDGPDAGKVRLEVRGLNAFNPAKGLVEAPDARHIMGIMTDTAYDGESFRARLINVRPVKRNQRTLRNLQSAFRGRIDAERWAQMQSATTVPFELPEPGIKIAVKVIDQTGTEHMAVLDDPRDPQWY